MTIWTIGHSTRTTEEFIALLREHAIDRLVDVRRFPGSRRLPQFGREALESALAAAQIGYLWVPALGGRRRPRTGSPNAGWRNDAFRGYADHMDTAEFAGGLAVLLEQASSQRVAIMCAEAVWWQCHRRLIADKLLSLGHTVTHILGPGRSEAHRLEPPALLVGGVLSYPASPAAPAQGRLQPD